MEITVNKRPSWENICTRVIFGKSPRSPRRGVQLLETSRVIRLRLEEVSKVFWLEN